MSLLAFGLVMPEKNWTWMFTGGKVAARLTRGERVPGTK